MKKLLSLLFLLPLLAHAAPAPWTYGGNSKALCFQAGIELPQSSTPASDPASGYDYLYFKSDDNLYAMGHSGVEVEIGGGSSPSYYQTFQNNGTPLTERPAANFSSNFTLTDNSGGNSTGVEVNHATGDLALTGGTLSGALGMGGFNINAVATPLVGTDAANKSYVDNSINGLQWKSSVRVATTSALPANTYNNGSSGVGATLTENSNGALTVDSVSVNVSDRILVKNEAAPANNGIYTVTATGSAGAVYVLTRATDFNSSSEIVAGSTALVTAGSSLATTAWDMVTAGTVTVGTTGIVFSQVSGPGAPLAGTGIGISGATINAQYDNSTIGINGSNQLYVPSGGITSTQIASGTITSTQLASSAVATGNIAANAVTTGKFQTIPNSTFLGNISGGTAAPTGVTLSAGTNVTLTPSGTTLTIAASGGGGSLTVVSKSSAFTAVAGDTYILTGSNYAITLPDATVATSGIWFTVNSNPIALSGPINFTTVSSQTVDGITSTNYALQTLHEKIYLYPDGSNWQVGMHKTDTGDLSDLTFTFSASFGTVSNVTEAYSRVAGNKISVLLTYKLTSVTTGTMSIGLPSTLTIDTTNLTSSTTTQFPGITLPINSNNGNLYSVSAWPFYDGSTTGTVFFSGSATSGGGFTKQPANDWNVSNYNQLSFVIPIVGWRP